MAFEKITQPGYLDLLVRRLNDDTPLAWLAQARELLEGEIGPHCTLLDIGCATGYAAKVFHDLRYHGVDIEERYLEVARKYFAGRDRVSFELRDLMREPLDRRMDLVILNAVLEHCPSINPALENVLESTGRTLLLRTFLGDRQEIHSVPSPNPAFSDSVRKFSNQYAFADVFQTLARHGFAGTVHRDRYTDSMPRYVDGGVRTFYFVKAVRQQERRATMGASQ